MGIRLSDWVENIVGKGEIARYEQFLLSHNVFKSCLLLIRQNEYLWSKGIRLKAYELFEDSDADLSWLLFLKKSTSGMELCESMTWVDPFFFFFFSLSLSLSQMYWAPFSQNIYLFSSMHVHYFGTRNR